MRKVTFLSLLCCFFAACAGEGTNHYSAVPEVLPGVEYREPGVINTPRNTGNLPTDLDPHTQRWGD